MPRNPKFKPADLPASPLSCWRRSAGPMTAEAISAASLAFKKALTERVLGGELNHHQGYPSGAVLTQ